MKQIHYKSKTLPIVSIARPCGLFIAFITVLLLPAGVELQAQSETFKKTVQVPADQTWTRTGVNVSPGTFVRIEASGMIEASSSNDTRAFYHQVPPEGAPELHSEKPYPRYPALMLIGKFDNGVVFPVGKKIALYAGQTYGSGELLLGINDDNLSDNSGAWNVAITVYSNKNTTIVGVWTWFNGGKVHIKSDGTMTGVYDDGTNSGNWTWDASRGVFILRWKKGGWIDTVTLSADGESLSGSNQYGTKMSATRTPPVYFDKTTPIVGAWLWFNGGRVHIKSDGTMSAVYNDGTNSGTWTWDASRGVFILRWQKGGWIDTVTLSADGQSFSGSNQYGTKMGATRIRP